MDNVEEFMGAVDKLDKEIKSFVEKNKGSTAVATVSYSLDMGDVQVNVWTHPSGYRTFRMRVDNQGKEWSIEVSKRVVQRVLEKHGWCAVSDKSGESAQSTAIYIRV